MMQRRPSRASRLAFLIALLPLLGACGDDPSGPDETDQMADRLEQLAESFGTNTAGTPALALFMASDAVRAGSPLRTLTVSVNDTVSTWTGIAMRMSLSETACEQLLREMEMPGETIMCAPQQFTVAWEGTRPELSRVISFFGDTGTVTLGGWDWIHAESPATFGFASIDEIDSQQSWWAESGTASTRQAAVDGSCPRRPGARDMELDYRCNIVRVRLALSATFEHVALGGFPVDPSNPGEVEPEPGLPARQVAIAEQVIGGMHLEILRFPDRPMMPRSSLQAQTAGSREPAVVTAARRYLAR